MALALLRSVLDCTTDLTLVSAFCAVLDSLWQPVNAILAKKTNKIIFSLD